MIDKEIFDCLTAPGNLLVCCLLFRHLSNKHYPLLLTLKVQTLVCCKPETNPRLQPSAGAGQIFSLPISSSNLLYYAERTSQPDALCSMPELISSQSATHTLVSTCPDCELSWPAPSCSSISSSVLFQSFLFAEPLYTKAHILILLPLTIRAAFAPILSWLFQDFVFTPTDSVLMHHPTIRLSRLQWTHQSSVRTKGTNIKPLLSTNSSSRSMGVVTTLVI